MLERVWRKVNPLALSVGMQIDTATMAIPLKLGIKLSALLCLVTQWRLILCDLMDCNLPGSSAMGILQARILEWVAILPPGESSQPRDWTQSPALQADSLPSEPPGKPKKLEWVAYPFSRVSSWPKNRTGVSCITGGFFTSWATREVLKLPYDPAIPLLGTYPTTEKDMWTSMFVYCRTISIARTWKQPRCPLTHEWIKKMWYVYTMEYSLHFSSVQSLSSVQLFVTP